MTARNDEQTAPPASNRKLIAAAILVVGVIVAFAVGQYQRSLQPRKESEQADSTSMSVDLGESTGSIDSIPDIPDVPETKNKTQKQLDATEIGDLAEVRSKESVENLPPAPEAKASNASKKQAPVRGPPDAITPPSKKQPKADAKAASTKTDKSAPKSDTKSAQLGKLVEIAKDTYRSSAGLIYGPGSQEGNRVKHVLRHAKDNPERPIHGVFDGKQDEIFAVIDEAWLIAKKGGKGFTVEYESNRAVYLVDLGRRIGYVGGKTGKREKNPPVKHLRLVLERQNVITAFPDRP